MKAYTWGPFKGSIGVAVFNVFDDPQVKQALADQGFVTIGSTPAEFSRVIADEIARNEKLASVVDFSQN